MFQFIQVGDISLHWCNLASNKVISMAANSGHPVVVHLARHICVIHVQDAMNMAAYGGHNYFVRLCYNNDNVDLDEVMEGPQVVKRQSSAYVKNFSDQSQVGYGMGCKKESRKHALVS